ncbi:MAG: DNA-binding response regulator [Frankiales bacterium]|nr:DNA-binding response regulator [Frankiales bacterium]
MPRSPRPGVAVAHAGPVDPISLLVVDDQAVFADALAAQLSAQPGFHPVVVAYGLAAATTRLATFQPDVALVDLRLGDGSGVELAARIRRSSPKTRVVILSAVESAEAAVDAVIAGVRVWLPKNVDTRTLVQMLRTAHRGEAWLPGPMLSAVLDGLADRIAGVISDPVELLSRRELEVLGLLAQGLRRTQIADELHVSEQTVRSHIQHIHAKLDVHTTVEAVGCYHRSTHRSPDVHA